MKIKEFAEVINGTTPSTKNDKYWGGNIKWITPAELSDGHNWYIYKTERMITSLAQRERNLKILPKDAVLLTSRAPIGKVAIAGNEMCTNQGFKAIICDKSVVNPHYLYYWLLNKKTFLNDLGRGATFKEISKTIVENIEIPVPSFEKQNRIVEIISTVLKLIDKRKQQIEALSSLKQSIFLDMFGDPAINAKNFKMMKLEKLSIKVTDGTHNSPPIVDEGKPYITAKHLSKGYLDFYTDPSYVSEEDHEKIYSRCSPVKGDVLYIKDGATTGIAAINHYNFEFSMLSSLALIKPDLNVLNNYYLVYYLNNNRVKEGILRKMSGGAIKRLTIKKINDLNIIVPPLELQKRFMMKILKIEQQELLMNNQLKQLNVLFNALSQKAFNGELFQNESTKLTT